MSSTTVNLSIPPDLQRRMDLMRGMDNEDILCFVVGYTEALLTWEVREFTTEVELALKITGSYYIEEYQSQIVKSAWREIFRDCLAFLEAAETNCQLYIGEQELDRVSGWESCGFAFALSRNNKYVGFRGKTALAGELNRASKAMGRAWLIYHPATRKLSHS